MTTPETSVPGGILADLELAAFVLAARQDTGPTARETGAAEMRRAARERSRTATRGPEVGPVTDLTVGNGSDGGNGDNGGNGGNGNSADGVRVRRYEPASEARGVVVFLHGGFWTIGDLDSHDRLCRRLVDAIGVEVVAVDYRRAPEHPWPAAVDDAVDVVRWVQNAAGGKRVAIMGDSAGGNLATLACLRLRDEGDPLPTLQVLAYPNTDLTLSQPSVTTKGTGWGLTSDAVAWGAEMWVPDPARRADASVSPLFADVRGLPSAIVVTAEHDPLRDEGDAYAARLAAAGVPVRHRCEASQLHGFLTSDTLSPSAKAAGGRLFADLVEMW